MKKTTAFLAITALGSAMAMVPFLASAQTEIDAAVSAGVGAQIDAGPQQSPEGVRGLIRQRLLEAQKNHEEQGDARNQAVEARLGEPAIGAERGASTTPPLEREARFNGMRRPEFASSTMMGSTTLRAEFRSDREAARDDRQDDRREARLEVFSKLQSRLVDQATQALSNLKQIRSRISDRIQTAEQNGRDMTDANAALSTADLKISAAETAIGALAAYRPQIEASTTVMASTTVSLDGAREVGQAVIAAVKDAREALKDVVVAIAHAMGLKIGEDGKIEATTTEPASVR